MSLIDSWMDELTLMERVRVSDGEGGFINTWTEGAHFKGAITLNTSMEAKIAEKQGVTSLYTLTTMRTTKLEYHDVFKASTGDYYRVTSAEQHTPNSALLDMAQVSCERWNLA